jgi:hypothetical protein
VAVILLATAGVLFLQGDSLAALRLALFLVLVPGMALFCLAAYRTIREPGCYRRPRDIARVMVILGPVLGLLPFILSLPWAPMAFAVNEMPFGLPLLLWLGVAFVYVGGTTMIGMSAPERWRERDWGDVISLAIVAAFGVVIAFRIISATA